MKSKSAEMFEWIKFTKVVSSVDVRKWGLNNFYIRADREARRMVESGRIEKMTEEEAILRGLRRNGNARIAWYRIKEEVA